MIRVRFEVGAGSCGKEPKSDSSQYQGADLMEVLAGQGGRLTIIIDIGSILDQPS